MKQDHIFVHLSSFDSIDIYPENVPQNFKVQLPERIRLDGSWTISLAEIEYPGKFLDKKPTFLYFEVDLCETSVVGGQKRSVLRRLHVDTHTNRKNEVTFNPLYDIPIRIQEFESIHVHIREPSWCMASFAGGFVSCTVQLKKQA